MQDVIIDKLRNAKYKVEKYLGKGSFAICYILRRNIHDLFAGKLIPYSELKRESKKQVKTEIEIQKSVDHENIVKYFSHFDALFNGSKHLVIVLELCQIWTKKFFCILSIMLETRVLFGFIFNE